MDARSNGNRLKNEISYKCPKNPLMAMKINMTTDLILEKDSDI